MYVGVTTGGDMTALTINKIEGEIYTVGNERFLTLELATRELLLQALQPVIKDSRARVEVAFLMADPEVREKVFAALRQCGMLA
jgi:hypothetical protein